ncbi:MAG: hypothetical protein HYY47_01705 [Deltaproteobacteria bacterium]|nr:hypothetical protein [Deltaproteobacteria bacterium]
MIGTKTRLAKAVSAREQRQRREPPGISLRQEIGPDQEQGWDQNVIEIVNDVFQPAAVKPGDRLLNPDQARQGAVRRVDQYCQRHQPEGLLKSCLLDKKQRKKGEHGPGGGIQMDKPRKKQG